MRERGRKRSGATGERADPLSCTRRQILIASLLALLGMPTVSSSASTFTRRMPAGLSGKMEKEIESRVLDQDGLHKENRALSSTEYTFLATLAALVLPSEAHSPGADEARVAQKIASMLGRDISMKNRYLEGFLSLDRLAETRYGNGFLSLSPSQQLELVTFLDTAGKHIYAEASTFAARLRRKLHYWYYRVWIRLTPTVDFWRQLQSDIVTQFYASSVAWDWLGYNGPPFPLGYANRPNTSTR